MLNFIFAIDAIIAIIIHYCRLPAFFITILLLIIDDYRLPYTLIIITLNIHIAFSDYADISLSPFHYYAIFSRHFHYAA